MAAQTCSEMTCLPLISQDGNSVSTVNLSHVQDSGNYTPIVLVDLTNTTEDDNLTRPNGGAWSTTANIVVMTFFMVTGILGNLLVIVVYMRNRRKRQSTANYFLCSLAIVDLIVCSVAIPIQIHLECAVFNRVIIALECAIFAYVWHVVMFTSAWMLVGISIDRYYCLCHPFNRRTQVRRVTHTILFIWAFTMTISIPVSLIYDDQCSKSRLNTLTSRLGVAIADSLISLVIPLSIIAGAYSKIFYVIYQRNNKTQNTGQGQKIMHHTRFIVAKRLLLVIGAFVLCWMPRVIAELYSATVHKESTSKPSPRTQILYVCKNIVPYVNSILNPILYSLINPRFRNECRRILFTCLGKFLPMPAAAAKYTCRSSSAL